MRIFGVSALLLSGLAAHADTISTFSLSGASIFLGLGGDQNLLTGSATIDTTTGIVEQIALTAGGVFRSGVAGQQGPIVYVGPGDTKISFDAGSLIGFSGGAFDVNGPNDLYAGHTTFAPMAATPEPGGLLLLATGLASGAGMLRRRFASSAPSSL